MTGPFRSKLGLYLQLIRWDKPIGTLLLLWPTLWALWIAAGGLPAWYLLLVFGLGTVLMRSAGCAINDYADRDFDLHVTRTKNRVLTSGKITPREALAVAAVCVVLAFVLVLFLNRLTVCWSLAAVLVAAAYPFFKRFFAVPQLVLGLAFSFGIPMAFAATQGHVPWLAGLLFAANLCWVIGYDTSYAMADKTDDRKLGLKTSAIAFGRFDALAVLVFYALFVGLMAVVLLQIKAGGLAWLGWALAALLCAVQAPWVLSRQASLCFKAFLFNHWVGLSLWLGLALSALA